MGSKPACKNKAPQKIVCMNNFAPNHFSFELVGQECSVCKAKSGSSKLPPDIGQPFCRPICNRQISMQKHTDVIRMPLTKPGWMYCSNSAVNWLNVPYVSAKKFTTKSYAIVISADRRFIFSSHIGVDFIDMVFHRCNCPMQDFSMSFVSPIF